MLTDGLFETHRFCVKQRGLSDTVTLVPFGDVHRDAALFSHDKWAEFLAHCRELENAVYIGMGDYFDLMSTSERAAVYGNMHDSTIESWEKDADRRIAAFAEEIGFMRGRLIGLHGGNHHFRFSDGTTCDQRLARLMGCKYLGCASAVRLVLQVNTVESSIDIFSHHGRGAGQTAAGRMMAVEKMTSVFEADIYLQGHNHARGILPLGDRMRLEHASKLPSGVRVKSRRCWLGRTGSFLRGYVEGKRSYVTDACLSPSSLGWIEFELRLHRETGARNHTRVDIRGIQ